MVEITNEGGGGSKLRAAEW